MAARLPPHDIDAEEAVLGALLIADADIYFYSGIKVVTGEIPQSAIDYHQAHLGPAVKETFRILQPQDFYRDRHGWIYEAIQSLKRAGSKVNQTTVAHALAENGKLMACGGAAYLIHLIANCPTTAFLLNYAKIVHDCAQLRGLIGAARQIEELGYSGDNNATKRAKQIIDRIKSTRPLPPTRDDLGFEL